jgi:predicted nucleic acid-binding protein
MIVVDANVLCAYVIEGERTRDAHALRQLDPEWLVPALWVVELQSVLRKYVRFKGMSLSDALDILDKAIAMFSPNEIALPPDVVLREALMWGISVYDAQYVSLAKQFGVRCVTEDGPLQNKCSEIAVSMQAFLKGLPGANVLRESHAPYQTRRRR